jgi:diguanylate cyclase (GGDEF)-like protein
MSRFILTRTDEGRIPFEYGYPLLALVSLVALSFTFLTAVSGLSFGAKVLAFVSIVFSYLLICAVLYRMQRTRLAASAKMSDVRSAQDIFDADIDEKLLVLEEAGKFFGASLKTNDMFRLISSRVGEILPFATCAFFVVDETNKFKVPFAAGKNSRLFESIRLDCGDGIAGKALANRQVARSRELSAERRVLDKNALAGLASAVAFPLFRGGEVFGVVVLYREEENGFAEETEMLAEAVGERITPLILGSYSFELSLSNALTDALTNLPNERAFYLVLENQVAEAQRFQERRPLTVLATDIREFDELNQKYGHSTGDRILAFAADLIKTQLRQMDLLCRTVNDEFLVILPTAGEEITRGIVTRIERAFSGMPFPVSETESCPIELSFGSATFQSDGETADQLMKIAILRKRQSKNNADNTVIFFPRQYVN